MAFVDDGILSNILFTWICFGIWPMVIYNCSGSIIFLLMNVYVFGNALSLLKVFELFLIHVI